jgi:hypothetical protein
MHHILKHALNQFPTWGISVIPQSTEKFMALTLYLGNRKTLKFIDSLQFCNCSLAQLAENLEGVTPLTSSVFNSGLIDGKGIFPYDAATSLEVLKST